MGNQDGLIDTEGLDQRPDVVGEREDVVAVSGTRRFTIAAKVRRVQASVAQCFHCRPPTHPSFGKSVEAEDRRRIALSRDRHMEGDPVGLYAPVLDIYRHRVSIAPHACLKTRYGDRQHTITNIFTIAPANLICHGDYPRRPMYERE